MRASTMGARSRVGVAAEISRKLSTSPVTLFPITLRLSSASDFAGIAGIRARNYLKTPIAVVQ